MTFLSLVLSLDRNFSLSQVLLTMRLNISRERFKINTAVIPIKAAYFLWAAGARISTSSWKLLRDNLFSF